MSEYRDRFRCNCVWHAAADRFCEKLRLNMRIGTDRLKTFTLYGSPSFKDVTTLDLAEAGFFYTGYSDAVECFYCGVRIHCWEKGDIPTEEHRKYRPSCAFVLGERTNNVPVIYNPFQDTVGAGFDFPCC